MPLFAKGYNDLIPRSYNELPVWQNYLRDNPRRLLLKRACPALLRPFFGLQIGNHCYSGIGNRALLAAPCRIAVRVSRRLNVQEVQADEPHGTGNLRTKDIPTGATLFRRHNKKRKSLGVFKDCLLDERDFASRNRNYFRTMPQDELHAA